MKISVITTTYNSAATLRSTMESVLAQIWPDVEHIIVDGGSTDGTMDLVREYEPRYGGKLRWVCERDRGMYDAMNKGIAMASGDVVGILNSDDFYTAPDVLERVALTMADDGIDAVYGDVHYVSVGELRECTRYYSSRWFHRRWMRLGFMPAHPSFYCRRKIYERYGGFDLSYKIAADFECLLRLIEVHRIRLRYIPMDFVTMRTGGASTSGLASHRQILLDHRRAFKANGIYSNVLMESLRYLYKACELLASRVSRLLRRTPCLVLVLCLSLLCIPQRMPAQDASHSGPAGNASCPATLPALPQAGTVDFFMGAELNYRDILFNGRVYDILVNLTPGLRWHLGHRWEVAAQAYVPVVNQYGDRYGRVRLNMAVLSKQLAAGRRWKMKVSGGLFGQERYGIDVKNMFIVSRWLALTAQAGLTGYCSMATGWEASRMGRLTALVGPEIWLHRWNTQLSVRGGRYVYGDWGVTGEGFRHFRHVSVGVYATYSDRGGEDAGFKVVVMLPPYKRSQRKVNFRPASNFRLTYSVEAEAYACRTYFTDPEQNERTGWFDRDLLPWGPDTMSPDYVVKDQRRD